LSGYPVTSSGGLLHTLSFFEIGIVVVNRVDVLV
jgi:hypothetical protein